MAEKQGVTFWETGEPQGVRSTGAPNLSARKYAPRIGLSISLNPVTPIKPLAFYSVCRLGNGLRAAFAKAKSTAQASLVLARPLLTLSLMCVFLVAAGGTADANPKYAAIIVNGSDGNVLFARNADARRYPASLTKMMTLYMLFEELDSGRLTLKSKLPVSATAASRPPSKLGLAPGSTIDVETAIKALAVKSANDVAAVVAEKLGGSESQFAAMMTTRARQIGLQRTKFRNASGLPDRSQYTTARDMATLGLRVYQDFPQYYHFFGLNSFTWSGRTYKTHNRIVKSYTGADGIKTGYIRASGFNVVTSAKRNGIHLIGVVMGGRTSSSRDQHMKTILTRQFTALEQNPALAKRFETIPIPMAKPFLEPFGIGSAMAAAPAPQAGTPIASSAFDQSGIPLRKPGEEASESEILAAVNAQSNKSTDNMQMASVAPVPAGLDPIGQLIAQSQGVIAPGAAQSQTFAQDADFKVLNPKDPLSPRIFAKSTATAPSLETSADAVGIQVGAYRYEEVAVQRLNAVLSKAPNLMQTQVAGIFPTEVGGRRLYRVRIGPYDRKQAQNACETLTAKGVSCYPVYKEEWPRLTQLLN